MGSISQGVSSVKNVLESEDVKSTINVCKKLGVKIKKIKSRYYEIYGKGLGSLVAKKNAELNFSNSGTASRLIRCTKYKSKYTSQIERGPFVE